MFSALPTIREAIEAEEQESDGRRARSAASRKKIITAMMDLVAEGHANPSAALVAEKAGVGLRSVFRHFDEKELIFREIDRILVRAYRPTLDAPYKSDTWQEQLFELIDRRCLVNEETVVFRLSSLMARYRSAFVKENYKSLVAGEEQQLNEVLPGSLQSDTSLGKAFYIATSFDTWRLLRQDKGLSASDTVAAIKEVVTDIIQRAGTCK